MAKMKAEGKENTAALSTNQMSIRQLNQQARTLRTALLLQKDIPEMFS